MDVSLPALVITPFVVFVAYLVFGMTGFGSSLLAVPLLAWFLPLKSVVPVMVVLDLTASLLVGTNARRHVSWSEIRWLLPPFVAGIAVGITLLINMPRDPLLFALGVVAIGFGATSMVRPGHARIAFRGWAIPSGFLGGTFSALFGTGGPLYAIYLAHRIRDKHRLRATVSAVISLSAILRVGAFVVTGLLLQEKLLLSILVLAPVMLLGITIGSRLHTHTGEDGMRRAFGAVLALCGTSLIVWVAF